MSTWNRHYKLFSFGSPRVLFDNTVQLMLSLSLHYFAGICSFAPRDVIEVMQNVNDFLDRNPTEVIVFIFQVNNNVGDEVNLNQFYDQLLLVNGLVNKLYIHPGRGNPWPTLRELTNPAYNKVSDCVAFIPSLVHSIWMSNFVLMIEYLTAKSKHASVVLCSVLFPHSAF